MKTASERIDELMKIHPKGFDLSLNRIEDLLKKLENPHRKIPPVIHVAGTNGKGSTIAFCRSILEAAGLSVHAHTSPYLVNWNERYRMGRAGAPGQFVDDALFSDAIRRVAEANDGKSITVFEVLTAVMFLLFSEHAADVCLVEVGLGGRFDATNVIAEPALTIITPVSIDHEAYLGDTLAKIAFEKAGIIKREVPLICSLQDPEALAVIEKQAARMRAPVQIAGEHFSTAAENGRMIWQGEDGLLDLPLPALPGDHQIENAGTAIAACRAFAVRQGFELTNAHVEAGMKTVIWPGRMQKLQSGRLVDLAPGNSEIWLDGGHNPGAAPMIESFMQSLDRKEQRPLTLICGMLTTKDPSGYFENLRDLAPNIITVPIISSDAGFPADELADHARKAGLTASVATSLKDAFTKLGEGQNHRILFAGSLYLVGDALEQNGTPPT